MLCCLLNLYSSVSNMFRAPFINFKNIPIRLLLESSTICIENFLFEKWNGICKGSLLQVAHYINQHFLSHLQSFISKQNFTPFLLGCSLFWSLHLFGTLEYFAAFNTLAQWCHMSHVLIYARWNAFFLWMYLLCLFIMIDIQRKNE